MQRSERNSIALHRVPLVWLIAFSWALETVQCLAIDQKNPSSSQAHTAVPVAPIGKPESVEATLGGDESSPTALRARSDLRRPIWALAHMVNSIKELDYRLASGANAVEVDVTFSREGEPLYTYHGPPCDCWRHCYQQEDFRDYLNYVREIAIDASSGPGLNLSLLFLDLKLDSLDQRAKANAGLQLARAVEECLFSSYATPRAQINSRSTGETNDTSSSGLGARETQTRQPLGSELPSMHLILSVNHVQDIDLVQNFIHRFETRNSSRLLRRVGFDVGMNDDLQLIETMWRRLGSSLNLWQGDGYTNCFSPFYNLERLSRALAKRDQPAGFPAKVYHWTIDLHDRIRESLRLGVDAIMTNHPERVLTVLHEPEMAHNYRLASRSDDPFRKLTRDSLGRYSGETARYQRSASATSGGFLGNLLDVFSSWLNYIREIPFLSLPTTLGSSRSHKRTQPPQQHQRQPSSGLTLVKLQNQSPEYSIGTNSSITPISDQQTSESQQVPSETSIYEGPKWYTTLASNVLVSLMKILLPT